ncbi:D-alanyl-D-alanine carboxypeptidase [Spirochaetota bacterium]|nr:D-alanyl-D-alanine carboxypeptidase [Spirochaetota bacterium]
MLYNGLRNGCSIMVFYVSLACSLLVSDIAAAQVGDFKQSTHITLVNFLTGRFDVENAVEFTKIGYPYAIRPMYLRSDTFAAFKSMRAAALKDGVNLVIVSGFRSYNDQVRIWERNYKRVSLSETDVSDRVKRILYYSSPPGVSRHHWGCEVDLNSVSPYYFNTTEGKKVAKWLMTHAKRFDFYLTYNEGRLKGFKSEPWQYSYYPTASKIMSFFRLYISAVNVDGFKGSHAVDVAKILDEYIIAINPEILKRMQLEGKIVY